MTELFPDSYRFKVDPNRTIESEKYYVVRIHLKNEGEAESWVHEFEKNSKTRWTVKAGNSTLNPKRMIYHKYWACHLSNKNLHNGCRRTKKTDCKASLDVKIKLTTVATKKIDPFLRLEPPLNGIIRLQLQHNHDVCCADNLRPRINPKIEQQFQSYFNNGMRPVQAIRFHEDKIRLLDNGCEKLADASINPKSQTVYRLYKKWKDANNGILPKPVEKLGEKLEAFQEKGLDVKMEMDSTEEVDPLDVSIKVERNLSVIKEDVDLDIVKTESDGYVETVPSAAGGYKNHNYIKVEKYDESKVFPAVKCEITGETGVATDAGEELKDEIKIEEHNVSSPFTNHQSESSDSGNDTSTILHKSQFICVEDSWGKCSEDSYTKSSQFSSNSHENSISLNPQEIKNECSSPVETQQDIKQECSDSDSFTWHEASDQSCTEYKVFSDASDISIDESSQPNRFLGEKQVSPKQVQNNSEQKVYRCDFCGSVFKSSHALMWHTKAHESTRHYDCKLCGKCFSRPYGLSEHLKSHSDERCYNCEFCDEAFKTTKALSRHMQLCR